MTSPLGFRLSHAVLSTISPPIPQAYQWATKYRASSERPLLDMSQGVPGAPPIESLRRGLAKSSSEASFSYCPAEGEVTMREALAKEMKTVYGAGTDVTKDDLALTAGANMAFVATVMCLADPGDEVILPTPWYFNHQMSLNLLGIKPVPLVTRPEVGYLPDVEDCKQLITKNTKAIALVSPNNPTGAVYPPTLLAAFASLARDHNIALIIDETYRDFIISNPPHALFSSPDWRQTFIQIVSFSKSYRIPGHRLGAIAASPAFITQLITVLDCLQICPPRPIQLALAPIMKELRTDIQDTAVQLHKRQQLFKEVLPSPWTIGAQGGYFAYVRHPFEKLRALEVSRRLAEEVGVLTLPSAFFKDNNNATADIEVPEEDRWIRFSVANVDDEKVKAICRRLAEFTKQ